MHLISLRLKHLCSHALELVYYKWHVSSLASVQTVFTSLYVPYPHIISMHSLQLTVQAIP